MQHRREAARILQVGLLARLALALHPLDVRARREARAPAGEHDRAHLRIFRGVRVSLVEAGDDPLVEGVVDFRPIECQAKDAGLAGDREALHHAKRTYSKSTGCRSMPVAGGAIHPANLPGSTTRPMSEATNARSPSLGSHSCSCAFHAASSTTSPVGETRTPASVPMRRLNALWGRKRRQATPVLSM